MAASLCNGLPKPLPLAKPNRSTLTPSHSPMPGMMPRWASQMSRKDRRPTSNNLKTRTKRPYSLTKWRRVS